MKNYSEMSDFEINCEIAKVMGYTAKGFIHDLHSGSWNPCVNASDAWQTIYDNKITLIACLDGWIACPYGSVIDGDTTESQSIMYVNSWNKATCFADSNPLRAAMIVFLMTQESKS